MVESSERVRCGLLRDQLVGIEELPESAEILQKLGPQLVQEVHASTRISWVRGEIMYRMVSVLVETIGLERGCTFYRENYRRAYDTPLFGALVRGSLRLSGSDPGSLLKMVPRGSSLVMQGFGLFAVDDRTAHSITISLTDAPQRCFADDEAWIRFAGASNLAVFDLIEAQGRVHVTVDSDRRVALLRYDW